MDSIHIHRFQARHRVADDAGRRVAQAAQQQLLDGELEAALARVNSGGEVVLIKRLSAQVRLSASQADRDNARRWSDALALSLARALHHAPAQELLRFAHRSQALLAYVADALQGQSARDWAWQQLALLPATRERRNSDAQRHQSLMRLLADDADDSVPLLRVLLHSPSWPLLIARLQDGELRGLAQSVFTRLAGSSVVGFAEPADDTSMAASSVASSSGTSATPAMFDAAPSWLRATVQAARTALRTRWALRLGCLLAQPSLAQRGALAVDAQLSAWSATAAGSRPEAVAADIADTADTEHAPAPAPAQGLVTKTAAAAATTSTPRAPLPAAQAAPASADTRGRTEHGGLLFLVPVLPLCGALALLQDAAVWSAASLPQALHRLALQLGPQAQDDAAALAFCGLLPDSPPPRPLQTTAAQDAALEGAQRLILDHLAERVPDWRGPALLTRLVRRAAVVSGDPGWIDIRFELRKVSLELRRAALDLDPGFVPWLGVVLRFRYE